MGNTVMAERWGDPITGGRRILSGLPKDDSTLTTHIGIAAVSPTGSALFLKTLSRRIAENSSLPQDLRFSVHHEPLAHYLEAIGRQDWMKVALLLRRSAELLARCGARFCVTPDAAVQQIIPAAADGSPIPWVSMADVTADQVAADGRKKVGIIGTELVMNSSTFQIPLGMRGVHVISPCESDRKEIDRIIFQELLLGIIRPESQAFAAQVISRLRADDGCDAVVLASSEAPLLVSAETSTLPIYQASDILAKHAVRYMAQGG
jgi:aspartate racemase